MAIHAVDKVCLEWCVGGKIQAVLRGHGSHRPRLLIAGEHSLNAAEIGRCTQYPALLAIIPRQYPKAAAPSVIDDIMDMPNCSSWEGVRSVPRRRVITRPVYVHFFPLRIVEILSPVRSAVGRSYDVQRPGATVDAVSDAEFLVAFTECHDCSRDSRDDGSGRHYGKRMKSVAH